MIANNTVMGDMRIGEEGAMIAHPRLHAASLSAGIHRHPFTDETIRTDVQRGCFALEFQILRRMADRGKRIDACACPNMGITGNRDMAD